MAHEGEGEEEEAAQKGHSILNAQSQHLGAGHHGLLNQHTEILLQFVFELHEMGHGVSLEMVMRKASEISRDFKDRSENAQHCIVRRWLKLKTQGLWF